MRRPAVPSIRRPSNAQCVERRFIRPVDVLDDHYHPTAERGEDGASNGPRIGGPGGQPSEPALRLGGEVEKRAEGRRRRDVLARPPQGATFDQRPERAHERRLADPGLARHEDESAALLRLRSARVASRVSRSSSADTSQCSTSARSGSSPPARTTRATPYDPSMAVAARPRTTELLERAEPLARLHEAYADALRGRGALLFVAGEAGVGKTALAHRVRTSSTPRPSGGVAIRLSRRLRWGPCSRSSREARPRRRCDPDRRRSARDRGSAPRHTSRPNAARGRLEDLHWADEATLDVLRVSDAGCRDADSGRRDLPRRRARPHASAAPRARRAQSATAVERLRSSRFRDAVARARRPARRRRGRASSADPGNPFFVTEVLASGCRAFRRRCATPCSPASRALSASARRRGGRRVAPPMRRLRRSHRLPGTPRRARRVRRRAGVLVAVERRRRVPPRAGARRREETLPRTRRRAPRAMLVALHDRPVERPPARLAHHAEGGRRREAVLRFAPVAGRAGGAPRRAPRGRRAVRARAPASRTPCRPRNGPTPRASHALLDDASERALRGIDRGTEGRRRSAPVARAAVRAGDHLARLSVPTDGGRVAEAEATASRRSPSRRCPAAPSSRPPTGLSCTPDGRVDTPTRCAGAAGRRARAAPGGPRALASEPRDGRRSVTAGNVQTWRRPSRARRSTIARTHEFEPPIADGHLELGWSLGEVYELAARGRARRIAPSTPRLDLADYARAARAGARVTGALGGGAAPAADRSPARRSAVTAITANSRSAPARPPR